MAVHGSGRMSIEALTYKIVEAGMRRMQSASWATPNTALGNRPLRILKINPKTRPNFTSYQ